MSDKERLPVGGQAVIEGVLMKGRDKWGLAVRKSSGEIFSEAWQVNSLAKKMPWRLPVVRGFVVMVEMLITGCKALSRSAELALGEVDEKLSFKDMCVSVLAAIGAVAGLFIALPLWAADYIGKALALSQVWINIIEGAARAGVFVAYIAVLGLWPDMRRVFAYHGAEHKCINAFEHGLEMTPENIMTCSRIHERCGTSFLLIAVIVSIAVFAFVSRGGFLWRVGTRVVLLPVVIGVAYEIIRAASRGGRLGKLIISPCLCLQFLTTREPDIKQAEVALAALAASGAIKN